MVVFSIRAYMLVFCPKNLNIVYIGVRANILLYYSLLSWFDPTKKQHRQHADGASLQAEKAGDPGSRYVMSS